MTAVIFVYLQWFRNRGIYRRGKKSTTFCLGSEPGHKGGPPTRLRSLSPVGGLVDGVGLEDEAALGADDVVGRVVGDEAALGADDVAGGVVGDEASLGADDVAGGVVGDKATLGAGDVAGGVVGDEAALGAEDVASGVVGDEAALGEDDARKKALNRTRFSHLD
ncbi:hypothetical protein LR48_Vigan123s001300 [Vigna angularis]|uniref:Uncharacterized protein n=1 Tax=Phaseolus angularis TaxID=3914 RepID=A0A0L9T4U0_PHAAN|nr:hypothetical protein LR48_Vigan123s001300 [Vigna angularis]